MPVAVTHALILFLLHCLSNTSATKSGGVAGVTTGGSINSNCTKIGTDCCVVGIDCDHILTPSKGHTDYFEVTGDDYAGKTLCIPTGTYRAIALRQVHGRPGSPVVITNCGGPVVFDGRGWNTIGAKGCRHIRLTGSSSVGGGGGSSSGRRGIVATNSATHGIHFDEGCSDIEVDHIETHTNGYAGIVIRTYPRCGGNCSETKDYGVCSRGGGFVQNNTLVHHNYIHDLPGEGLYIGTSHYHMDERGYIYDPHGNCPGETGAEPPLNGVKIYHNTLHNIGMDAIQIGAATESVQVHHNTLQRFATSHKYGHSYGIAMNPGSTGHIFNNWIEGIRDDKSGDGDFGIALYGHGSDDQLSRVYNNVILHVVVPFSFYNREDAANQRYEFVHNTVYNFTGTSPVKFYCIGTVDPEDQPPVQAIVQNNVFAEGPNAQVLEEPYGYKKFYGNTNGIIGLDCLDYHDARENNLWRLVENTTTTAVDFVNATDHDFHLVESSSARETGVVLNNGPILTDYDGINRTVVPSDQGAYQFESSLSCVSHLECDDSNVCTTDQCTNNGTNRGECIHSNILGCCQTKGDCDDHADKCRKKKCKQNKCKFKEKICNDRNRCTRDKCKAQNGRCKFRVKKNCVCVQMNGICEKRKDCCSRDCESDGLGAKRCRE